MEAQISPRSESIATALPRVGSVRLRLGMVKPAEEALRQALEIDQRLANESPASFEIPLSDSVAMGHPGRTPPG